MDPFMKNTFMKNTFMMYFEYEKYIYDERGQTVIQLWGKCQLGEGH